MKEKEGNCESLGFVWFFCSISLISSRVSDATEKNSRNRRSHVTEKFIFCRQGRDTTLEFCTVRQEDADNDVIVSQQAMLA